MINTFNIEKAFKMKAERGWGMLYVAIDLHSTLIKPHHDVIEYYPGAIEVIKWFNSRPDFRIILWTSSYPAEIVKFLEDTWKVGIRFDYVNQNPLEQNSKLACFNRKFYFNILLDDRAGFNGETDWLKIKEALITINEWQKSPLFA